MKWPKNAITVKPVKNVHSKIDETKILMTNGSLLSFLKWPFYTGFTVCLICLNIQIKKGKDKNDLSSLKLPVYALKQTFHIEKNSMQMVDKNPTPSGMMKKLQEDKYGLLS